MKTWVRIVSTLMAGAAAAILSGCTGTTAGGTVAAGGTSITPSGTTVTGSSSTGSSAGTRPATGSGAGSSLTSAPGSGTPQATESNPPGDIPDNQAYVPFSPAGAPVTVKVPEGWARTSSGPTTVFTDKLNRIEITTSSAPTAPTVASVQSVDLPTLQGSVPAFAPGNVAAVTRTAGAAILVTYQGDSAPNPVTSKVVRDAFERYIFYRGGTRVDLTLVGPTNADNVDPWRTVTDSLQWQ